jgi:signal transduction histidine kinase/DNA-binding response OmpR family regulator
MQNDANGNLWLSSNNGIWICDINGEIIRHLTQEDGLQSNQYNFGATFRSSTGKLFFGGINGFNVFNSEKIEDNTILPVVTARINYKDNDGSDFTSDRITKTGTIKIPRTVSTFSIDFECLSYTAPHKHRFAYSIDDNAETIFTSEPSVTLMNFPHGKHTINVTACNGDGYWSDEKVTLIINNQPPLLKSIGANAIYLLILASTLILIISTREKRREERSRIRLNEIKTQQEQEAYTAKINFFTHVAHEIKTPVTLIKAPLEVILKNEQDEANKKNLDIIEKNTKRLLSLVNQLLDFKKVSSTGHDISVEPSRPATIIQEVVNRFDGATPDNIIIETSPMDVAISCMLDPEAYTKIVSNLISNAVKHAHSWIKVLMDIRQNEHGQIIHLEAKDDGCGIPEQSLPHIFDTFYQVNTEENPRMSGVGIGLAMVKLLVQKHNGSVYVDQTYKDGCCICVDIPYISVPIPAETEQGDIETHGVNMLIVEDTKDMLEFISSVFDGNSLVFKAGNGKDALEILKNHDIDIIISDISMPVMNGFEMLKQIRNNDLFRHIPVIMLTVENSLETKIKGLEYGADAYIEKPFSTKHLKVTVDNLLNRRENLRKRFTYSPLKQENDSITSDKDKEWFARVTELINSNISEPEISIDTLAGDLNMSRSSFQRKIKGLTGLSPVEFIRLIRLKKAAELLSAGTYRINEVSYMVGFNKPSYFSALFKKQFGVLPKEFISMEES